ncbi:hypothetical protein JMUB7545_27490 [Staphylococcus aureus]
MQNIAIATKMIKPYTFKYPIRFKEAISDSNRPVSYTHLTLPTTERV